ncbi:MAG: aspartate kinase [Candidatus Sericytochromatia bacterium]|nr:aspartate kinase [Candidatus Sericytochromatia bacterium]
MSIIVKKFGGTSVADPQKILHVARRLIETKQPGEDTVVVVSAMGHSTDHLVALANEVAMDGDQREMDMLLATGEQVTIALLAMALQSLGQPAISLTGPQAGIHTDGLYGRSRVVKVDADRIHNELKQGKIVVVAGFQGLCVDEITTLGRGGSDTSAVVLAAALGAPVCEIYTDVAGVYTCDPRIVPNARKLTEISYEEMLELASLGAQVLHPRSVECAKDHGIVIHVRSTFRSDEGTFVKGVEALETQNPVNGVTLDLNQAKVALLNVPDRPGVAATLFQAIGKAGISVDMIIQSVRGEITNDIAFTVAAGDLEKTKKVAEQIAQDIGGGEVVFDPNIAKVSIVGVGMVGRPAVASSMFEALSSRGINIQMISTSEIKISCVVEKARAKEAAQSIHEFFGLEQSVQPQLV